MDKEGIITVDTVDVGIDSTKPSNKVTWSTGRNVRFIPGYVTKTPGKTILSSSVHSTGLNIRASFTFVGPDSNVYTIICTDNRIWAANREFTNFTEVTPASPPTGGYYDLWQFCIVAGLPYLTNGKDAIWKWTDPAGVLIVSSAPLAKNISSCMGFLVCSNIYEGGAWHYGRVRWGRPEAFTVDKTDQAGYIDLANYYGNDVSVHNILCQISEGSKTYFFTEKNRWVCDFSQSRKDFFIDDGSIELMSPKSACAFRGKIYAFAKDDIYVYEGSNKKVVGTPFKRDIYSTVNALYIDTIFIFSIFATNEIWFCIPTGANTLPDTAYIYNEDINGWSPCDCDFTCHALQYSKTVAWVNNLGTTITWENDSAQTIPWLAEFYRSNPQDIVGTSNGYILKMDSGYNAVNSSGQATAIYGLIETGDMDCKARPFEKIVEECYPDLLAQTLTNSLMIQVGVRDNLSKALRWSPAVAFKIGQSDYADLRSYTAQGAFVRLRFYSNALDSPWALGGYSQKYSIGRAIR
jgi:hypothetical protein